MDGFADGDDLCAGCSICCRHVSGLLVNAAELERLPLMKPHVVDTDGVLSSVDMPYGCPYLLPDGWCGVFAIRPFDCSLFPAQVGGIRRDPGRSTISVTWRYGGDECPQRDRFITQGTADGRLEALRNWTSEATGSESIILRRDRSQDGVRGIVRRSVVHLLHKTHLLPVVKALLCSHGIGKGS